MLASVQEVLSDKVILVSVLAVDIDNQHESDKDDSQSEVSEVLVKPNSFQVRAVIDTLMNYSMTAPTAELQGLTVEAPRLVELETTSCVKLERTTDFFSS